MNVFVILVACEEVPSEDGKKNQRAKRADERETDEFGERSDRGGRFV